MNRLLNKTHFGHIYGYGLLILWMTTCLLTVVATMISEATQISQAFAIMPYTIGILTFIALPFAALLTLIIAGTIWLTLSNARLTNRQKAIFAGGMTGALPALVFFLSSGSFNLGLFVVTISLSILGMWCGWIGEWLARRHVRVNPETVAETFE